jgi:hydrogenase maturation protease
MSTRRILVAGIGNIFLGDDGFGPEVLRRLAALQWPPEVTVRDFGIRGYDLGYAIADGYETIVFVDATARGRPPGTLLLIELDPPSDIGHADAAANGHSLDPVMALRLAAAIGARLGRLLLVGCEPGPLEDENGDMALSASVTAAVPEAVSMVRSLVREFLSSESTQCLPETAAPNIGNYNECLGNSRNRSRDPGAVLSGENDPRTTPVPSHA